MALLELPDAIRGNILSFLSVLSPEYLSLACSCRHHFQEVETLSNKELDRILTGGEHHTVDDDWMYRAAMQAVAAAPHRAGWELSVSQRRMLRTAYRMHIYSLGTDPSQACTDVLDLAMHPDGKRLLSHDCSPLGFVPILGEAGGLVLLMRLTSALESFAAALDRRGVWPI
jgi:hypothetical protein